MLERKKIVETFQTLTRTGSKRNSMKKINRTVAGDFSSDFLKFIKT